jgi:hypothetical protein
MKYNIAVIPHYLVSYMFSNTDVTSIVQSIIDKAHGEMTLITVIEKLQNGKAMLVVCFDGTQVKGLVILQVEVFDTGLRVLNVSMGGGDISIFTGEYDSALLALAKDLECDEIRAIGARLGWENVLKKANTNWEKLSTTLIHKVEV